MHALILAIGFALAGQSKTVVAGPYKQVFTIVDPAGHQVKVYGWKDADGKVRWYPHEQTPCNLTGVCPLPDQNQAPAVPTSSPPGKAEPIRDKPPVDQALPQLDPALLNGVIQEQRLKTPDREVFTASSPEAHAFVAEVHAAQSLPSQPAQVEMNAPTETHLTVIGPAASRAAVMRDLKTHPALVALRDQVQVQEYEPDAWPVKGIYPTHGQPSIIIQSYKPGDRTGPVVWRANDYSSGPEVLAQELRKANPNYDPSLDPGPANGKSKTCPVGFTHEHTPYVLAALGVVAVLLVPNAGKAASNV